MAFAGIAGRLKSSLLLENLFSIQKRNTAHGEMYMPKSLYRIGGSTKTIRVVKPEFRSCRAKKVLRVVIPDLDSYYSKKLEEEDHVAYVRKFMKLYGVEPSRPEVRQTKFFVACSPSIFDPYQPPENEGSFSSISSEKGVGLKGAVKSKVSNVVDKTKDMALRRWQKALKKIIAADPEFDVKSFAEQALKIYIDAHKALQNRDENRLHDLVTERAYPNMWQEMECKTLRWEYVQSLEPPTVVNLRHAGDDKTSEFGQATVRFYSQQKLAIYNQFGRLYMGSEDVVRDVLEYVVFENYLSNEYGFWRMHGKIGVKSAMDQQVPKVIMTYRKEALKTQSDDEKRLKYSYKIDEKTMDDVPPPSDENKPALAT